MNPPTTITAADLASALVGQVNQFPTETVDSSYYLVSPDFLNGEFAGSFRDLQMLLGVRDWEEEINDCDKCSGLAKSWAGVLHARTIRKHAFARAGLAFGVWHYKPDWSQSNHSINIFVYGVPVDESHPAGLAVGFYEPAKLRVIELSDKEINSCFKCAF